MPRLSCRQPHGSSPLQLPHTSHGSGPWEYVGGTLQVAQFLAGLQQFVDRELARFIYVREVKRFDPLKFSIYAWCIKIAIAGSLAPVRLAWVPFLRVPKNGFIYVEADTKKLYAGL